MAKCCPIFVKVLTSTYKSSNQAKGEKDHNRYSGHIDYTNGGAGCTTLFF